MPALTGIQKLLDVVDKFFRVSFCPPPPALAGERTGSRKAGDALG